jgi:hypothetical protein
MKFLAGAITGGVGSFVGNPFDVLKTLAQTNKDKSAPLMTMVGDMYKNQGIAGFYRGVEANIMRACVLNATKMGMFKRMVTELNLCYEGNISHIIFHPSLPSSRPNTGCYDLSKGYVCDATGWSRKDVRTSFCAAFIAGFFMTCTGRSKTSTCSIFLLDLAKKSLHP